MGLLAFMMLGPPRIRRNRFARSNTIIRLLVSLLHVDLFCLFSFSFNFVEFFFFIFLFLRLLVMSQESDKEITPVMPSTPGASVQSSLEESVVPAAGYNREGSMVDNTLNVSAINSKE